MTYLDALITNLYTTVKSRGSDVLIVSQDEERRLAGNGYHVTTVVPVDLCITNQTTFRIARTDGLLTDLGTTSIFLMTRPSQS